MASRTPSALMARSSAGEPASRRTGGRPSAAGPYVLDGLVGLVGQEVARHDQERGRLQRVAPADQVERVLQVVGAAGHRHPGVQQRPDAR